MGMLIQKNLCAVTAYWGAFFFFLQITHGQRRKIKQKMKVELRKTNTMTELEANAIQDVWQLDLSSRWRLYRWQSYFAGPVRQVFPRIVPVGKLCQTMMFLPVSVQLLVWTCLFLPSLYCMGSNVIPCLCICSGVSTDGNNPLPKRHGGSFELNPVRTYGSPSCFPCSVW